MEVKPLDSVVYETFKGVMTMKNFTQCLVQLVMNSLDADSTAICARVSVRRGLVQVKDDGCGITAENLLQIGERFVTSRRQGRTLSCYGHRGEGLNALGTVAESVVVVTQPRGSDTALRRRVNERDSLVLPEPSGRSEPGTTVAAFGLHRRLLRGPAHSKTETEFEDMQRAMHEFVLVHPKVRFSFYNADDDTQLLNHGRPNTVQKALVCIHPNLKVDMLQLFRFHKKKCSIEALLYKKTYESEKAQYLYVNKRPVLCSEIQKFVMAQYQKRVFATGEERSSISTKKRHPVYVINLNLPQTYYELLFSGDNKCEVLFLHLPLILKYLEKVFNILVGQKAQVAGKSCGKPAENFAPFGFPSLNGVVSASAYKCKQKSSSPKDVNPRKDNYAIQDDSRNEFVIPPTELHANKPGPSKRPSEQRHTKRKGLKRPLPIGINTKLPLLVSEKHTNSHEDSAKQAKKVKKSEETPFMPICSHESMELEKRAEIVSQKHADQVAHLVEDDDFEGIPLTCKDIKGKVFIMGMFLKSLRQYKEESTSVNVSLMEGENTNDLTNNLEAIAKSVSSLDITVKVSSKNGGTQLLSDADFDVECKSNTDVQYCEPEKGRGEKEYGSAQNKNEEFMFKLSGNENKEFRLPHAISNSSLGKKHIELVRKNVTSKCVQTSLFLGHETRGQVSMLETADDINYNPALFFQEHPLPKRKRLQTKLNKPNGAFENIDRAPCPAPRIQTANYQVQPTLFSTYEPNCAEPKRKSMKKYPSNYDCNFSNLNDIPLLKCNSGVPPYYFSYKDKTVKLFDCYERKFQNCQQFCSDHSKPFQLISNGNNLIQERLLPCNTHRQTFQGREVNFEKPECVQFQAKDHHMHSNGYETCLEDTDLSPIRKIPVDSCEQHCFPKPTLNFVNNLPTFKKKLVFNNQMNTNVVKGRCYQKVIPAFNKHITSENHLQTNNIHIGQCTADKHDKETIPDCYPHNTSKYFSPHFKKSRSNFVGVKDTFDLDNKFTEHYRSDIANKSNDITRETANFRSEMFAETKRFKENMLSNEPASLNNESCTFLKNVSAASFQRTQLSFVRKQNKKFALNVQTSAEEVVSSKEGKCFSLEVHPQVLSHQPMSQSSVRITQNSQANRTTLIGNKENHNDMSTVNFALGETNVPLTPLSENTYKIRAEDFLENSSPKEGVVESKAACLTEWTKMLDQFGTTFYYNKRTGMTTFCSPKTEGKFSLAPRSEFVPKGLSPVLVKWNSVDKTLSPRGKEDLQRVIIDSYENELLTIKWLNCGYQNDPKAFFDELYKDKAKFHQPPVPIAAKSSLASIRFNRSIFSNVIVIGQVDFKFVAALTNVTGHILLFDQHAVHERICLERLQKEYNKASWILRHPVTIFLQNCDLIFVRNQLPYLTNLGLTFDFISNGITVRGIPLCIWRRIFKEKENDMKHVAEVIQIIIDQVLEVIKSEEGLVCSPPIIEDVIKMEACRGAIKFGQPLSRDMCQHLIEDLQGCALPFQCAHGRPTVQPLLQLTKATNSLTKRSDK